MTLPFESFLRDFTKDEKGRNDTFCQIMVEQNYFPGEMGKSLVLGTVFFEKYAVAYKFDEKSIGIDGKILKRTAPGPGPGPSPGPEPEPTNGGKFPVWIGIVIGIVVVAVIVGGIVIYRKRRALSGLQNHHPYFIEGSKN